MVTIRNQLIHSYVLLAIQHVLHDMGRSSTIAKLVLLNMLKL